MSLISTVRLDIYQAIKKDIKAIMALENDVANRDFIWQGTYDEHVKEIRDKHHLLIVFREKKTNDMEGFALIGLNFKSESFELRRIAIAKKGMGYGREVVSALMKYAFERLNFNRFWLDVYPDNVIGIELYENLGMKREGVLRQSYKSKRGYSDQIIYALLKSEYFQKRHTL